MRWLFLPVPGFELRGTHDTNKIYSTRQNHHACSAFSCLVVSCSAFSFQIGCSLRCSLYFRCFPSIVFFSSSIQYPCGTIHVDLAMMRFSPSCTASASKVKGIVELRAETADENRRCPPLMTLGVPSGRSPTRPGNLAGPTARNCAPTGCCSLILSTEVLVDVSGVAQIITFPCLVLTQRSALLLPCDCLQGTTSRNADTTGASE